MAHHPFSLISAFDRSATQWRVETACHFFHCGHLHSPYAVNVPTQSGNCLTLAAGASYESREARNSYTIVTLDPLHANANVTFVRYDPTHGAFEGGQPQSFHVDIRGPQAVSLRELALAIREYAPVVADYCYYLAALLLGEVADLPIVTDQGVAFGTVAVLRKQQDDEWTKCTSEFLAVSNALRVLSNTATSEVLAANGEPLRAYGDGLDSLARVKEALNKSDCLR